jgi:hypothetical protein
VRKSTLSLKRSEGLKKRRLADVEGICSGMVCSAELFTDNCKDNYRRSDAFDLSGKKVMFSAVCQFQREEKLSAPRDLRLSPEKAVIITSGSLHVDGNERHQSSAVASFGLAAERSGVFVECLY